MRTVSNEQRRNGCQWMDEQENVKFSIEKAIGDSLPATLDDITPQDIAETEWPHYPDAY
jgi:hypothetical protein